MKKVLIIAAEYPPSATVGAKRPAKLAARIAEHGWSPCVLTMAEEDYELTDPGSVSDELRAVPTVRRPSRSVWLSSEDWQRRPRGLPRLMGMASRAFAKFTQRFLPIDKYYPWAWSSLRSAVRLVEREGIDLIWATVRPLSAAELALRVSKRTGVPYVVDFRDVPTKGIGKDDVSRRKHRRLFADERRLACGASGITIAAPSYRDLLRDAHGDVIGAPFHVATNWYEQEAMEACPPEPFERPVILLVGTLYAGGTPQMKGFLEALKMVADDEAHRENPPQFIHLSQHGVASELDDIARAVGVADLVRLSDRLPESRFRSYCRGSAVLLVQVRRVLNEAGIIPAKVYEYFAACRPILVIGPEGCEAGRMVVKTRRGLAVTEDAPLAIANALRALLDPQAVAEQFDLSIDAVRAYEAGSVIAGMCQFFDEIVQP